MKIFHISHAPSSIVVHGIMLLNTILVATSFTVGKAIAKDLDPGVLILLRFILAAGLFFPCVQWKFGIKRPNLSALFGYATISAALVGFFWLMFLSLRYTTALNTGVIFTLVPGISSIYAMIILKERLGKFRLISLLIATIGAVWVIFRGDLQLLLSMQMNVGDIIFLAGCLMMGFYTPLVKFFHQGEPMMLMTFWIMVTGTCWLLLLSGYKLGSVHWQLVPLSTWAGIIYLAIFTTIITFFLSQWATLYLGPTRVMAYSFLYPPIIIIFDILLGKDMPPTATLLGVLLIFPAMIIIQRGSTTN